MADKPYIPVSCEVHSEFELLIMHNSSINLNWQDETGLTRTATVKPVDIQTRSGEEFLLVTDNDNEQHQVRLDRIQHFEKT